MIAALFLWLIITGIEFMPGVDFMYLGGISYFGQLLMFPIFWTILLIHYLYIKLKIKQTREKMIARQNLSEDSEDSNDNTLPFENSFCGNCGNKISVVDSACPNCGKKFY